MTRSKTARRRSRSASAAASHPLASMSHSVPSVIVKGDYRAYRTHRSYIFLFSSQRRVRQNRWWDRFKETRECGSAVGFGAAVNIDRRVNEVQLLFRARRCDVEQPALLVVIVKLILKTARRKPTVRHPDYEQVIPLETLC